MQHNLRRRCDPLFINVPLPIGRWHFIITGRVVSKVTVESTDPPRLVRIGIRQPRTPRGLAIGAIPSHPAIPIARARNRTRFRFDRRRGRRNEQPVYLGEACSRDFDKERVRFQLFSLAHDVFFVWLMAGLNDGLVASGIASALHGLPAWALVKLIWGNHRKNSTMSNIDERIPQTYFGKKEP